MPERERQPRNRERDEVALQNAFEEFNDNLAYWYDSGVDRVDLLRLDLWPEKVISPIYRGREIDYEGLMKKMHDVMIHYRADQNPVTRDIKMMNPSYTTSNIQAFKEKYPKKELLLSRTVYSLKSNPDDPEYNPYVLRFRYLDFESGFGLGETWVGMAVLRDREPEFLRDYDREINR